MTTKYLIGYLFLMLAFGSLELKASDWKTLVDLRGNWSFTVGDDPAWANPNYAADDWDQVIAPRQWEHYYEGYNGFAWYRKNFGVASLPQTEMVSLFLGYIDDVDEVFLNGRKVGQSGSFPPNFETAYNQERHYLVPVKWLKREGNVIAIRVFDEGREGGIIRAGKLGFYYDLDQSLMTVDLSGKWKFSTRDFGNMHNPQTDDEQWNEIFVPMAWENQGYSGYDGRAWYRKRFVISDELRNEKLYLVLGRIDDFEKVYLNGEKIGGVEDLEGYSRFQRNDSYQLFRIYPIPADVLRTKNMISIEVEDIFADGGIYEGPVGIVKEGIMNELKDRMRWEEDNGGWKSFVRDLIRLFD